MILRSGLPRRLAASAAVATLSLTSMAACSGDDGASSNSKADQDDDGESSPEEVLAAAKKTFDDTSGVRLSIDTVDLPDGTQGLQDAEGVATHAPAFEGEVTVIVAGSPFNAPVTAVDDKVYAELPGVPVAQEIDPGEYGAPDPAQLMDPDAGFSALLTETEDVEEGDTVRGGKDNKEVLTEYSGTVPGSAVEGVIPSAEGDFEVTYTVTEDLELRETTLTGVFYPDTDEMTYTIGIDDYGTEKDIKAP